AAAAAGAVLSRRRRALDFRDRVVLITGGSRGLGLELARRFASQGAKLALLARKGTELERATAHLASANGGSQDHTEVELLECDLRDQEQVERSVARTVRRFGRLDVLVNNAGTIRVGPFDNLSLRMAAQHAVNKESVAEVVASGHYTLGAGPIAPTLIGYDPSLAERYPYDPAQAEALIAESGLSDISFELLNRSGSFWPLLGQLIQADLAAVGITVTLQSLEDAEFFDRLNSGEVQAFVNDWTWDNGDPDNVMYSLFTHERAVNRMGYQNETVNELNLEAQETADPDARAALYAEAQKLILDDAIMVILGYPEKAIGAQAAVQNLKVSPVGSVVLREVDLDG
ncbi:MAG: SDR family NAD(P)-dependent oxidoreductase, partial [Phycisphaeraceae bacterium]